MPTLMQWVHVSAAVVGVGGMAFMLFLLMPSLRVLTPDQRDVLMKKVQAKFRLVSWSVILLLIVSGLFNVRTFYWELAWGRAWAFLTVKIVLAIAVFALSFALTMPLPIFDKIRAQRQRWLIVAFTLAMIVILISTYLRRS